MEKNMEKFYLSLKNKTIKPYTLIFLIKNNKVLLMERINTKSLMAGKLLGLGGKIENDELLIESACREFYEETGAQFKNPIFRGTFIWIKEKDSAGISYILTANEYSGEIVTDSKEGKLAWY